jgi:8-oxo-dGTP diphosphatase
MSPTIVIAAIAIRSQRVLIARRGPTQKLAGLWEFPGGKLELGETPEACLAREITEEFGIDVRVSTFLARNLHYHDHGVIDLRAYRVDWPDVEYEPLVHDAVRWVQGDEVLEYELAPADIPIAKVVQALLESV